MAGDKQKLSIIKDALVLFIITLAAAGLLGLVNEVTKGPIAEQEAKTKEMAYQKVFESAVSIDTEDEAIKAKLAGSENLLAGAHLSNMTIEEAGIVRDGQGNALGYVMTVTTPDGYDGDITITMGYTLDQKVTKIEFIKITETAGFGQNAKEASYKDQYINKSGAKLLKTTGGPGDGEAVDGISGATITSEAVIEAVNAGIVFANDLLAGGVGGIK